MKTDLRKKAKIDFEKDFQNLMINAAFGKTTENVKKYRYITKFFTENVLAKEMKKKKKKNTYE